MAVITSSLKENLTADGNTTDSVKTDGSFVFYAYGTFGGGTAAVQISFDGGNNFISFLDQSGNPVSLTSNGYYAANMPTPALYRINLSGSTSPDLDVRILLG